MSESTHACVTAVHAVDVTDTNVGSNVPNAGFVVAAEQVRQVEHYVFVNVPIRE